MRLLYLNTNGGQIQDLGVSIGSAIADNFLILLFSFLLILAPLAEGSEIKNFILKMAKNHSAGN